MNLYYLSREEYADKEIVNKDKIFLYCYDSIESAMKEHFKNSYYNDFNLYKISSIGFNPILNMDRLYTNKIKIIKKIPVSKLIKDSNFKYSKVEEYNKIKFILGFKNISDEELIDFYKRLPKNFPFFSYFFTDQAVTLSALKLILEEELLKNDDCEIQGLISRLLLNPNVDSEFLKYLIDIMISRKITVTSYCNHKKINEEIYLNMIDSVNSISGINILIEYTLLSKEVFKRIIEKLYSYSISKSESGFESGFMGIAEALYNILKKYKIYIDSKSLIFMLDIAEYVDDLMRPRMVEEIVAEPNFSVEVLVAKYKIIQENLSSEMLNELLSKFNLDKISFDNMLVLLSEKKDLSKDNNNITKKQVRDKIIKQINTTVDIKLFKVFMITEDFELKELIESQAQESELPKLSYKKEKLKLLNKYMLEFDFISIKILIMQEMIKLGVLNKKDLFDSSFIGKCNRNNKLCDIFIEKLKLDNYIEEPKKVPIKRRGV